MDIFKVCLSQKSYCDIPSSAMRGILSNSITEKQVPIRKKQVKEFVELTGKKGHPFCPSTFSGKGFNKDAFEQTQLFVLTFDYQSNFNKTHNSNLSYADISAKADLYNLPIFFAYTIPATFDLIPDDRVFCIVFRNEYPIYNYREAETLLKALLTIFPEANRTNSRVTDLYFGGNEILHFDKSLPTINPDLVFMNLYCYLRIRYGENNFKRKSEEFAEETGIILNNGKPYVTFFSKEPAEEPMNISDKFIEEESCEDSPQFEDKKKSPKPIMYKNGFGENFSRLIYSINFLNDDHQITFDQSSADVKSSKHQLYRSETIRSIRLNCKLYQDFESDRHIESLAFRKLLGIATNLVFVESGPRTFRRILGSKSCNSEKMSSLWKHYFRYLKGRKPYPCNSFCPYHMICSHGENILSTCKLRPGQIERISGYELPLVELEEAIKDFKEKFQIAVMSSDNVWHVIKSQTALGKTETILRWIKDHSEMKVLIVVPTGSSGQELDYMRVEFGKLDSGISSSKLPKDFPTMSILCAGPGTDSSSEGFCVRLGLGKSLSA